LLQQWSYHQFFFADDMSMMIYPLTIGGACILTSILGTFFVKLGKSKNVIMHYIKVLLYQQLLH
jgi:Na+/H+-translocating membrane pyrophosphatase